MTASRGRREKAALFGGAIPFCWRGAPSGISDAFGAAGQRSTIMDMTTLLIIVAAACFQGPSTMTLRTLSLKQLGIYATLGY